MLKPLYVTCVLALVVSFELTAREYHVAKSGLDTNSGDRDCPFLTIQAAADVAEAGDVVTVHAGIYRERVNPRRGGISEQTRIEYRAAVGERVEVKGSEVIGEWQRFSGTVWKTVVPNSRFGDYNPYSELIRGDWFDGKGRDHHTGEVYLNGKSLWEMDLLERVLHPVAVTDNWDPEGSTYTWYCEVDEENTYLYANFHETDPTTELVEINVRPTCFYPEKTGINYITVSGFHMSQAATPWSPPTAEQIGLIGTNWSKGWVIENNVIRNAKCVGITLGKYGDRFDNTSASSSEGYVETIKRALDRGWTKDRIGAHTVRNNSISSCGQAGICGSLGGIFSVIEGNAVFDIWTKRQFTGPEPAGIKIHAAIDMVISGNRVANAGRGIWLDWMAQGSRVSANLCYDNDLQDFYAEVNHGPYLVDNNLFLSQCAVWDMSQGGAYVHNLLAGRLNLSPHSRLTPYHLPHSTQIAGYRETLGGDDRFVNNIFVANSEINADQPNPQLATRAVYGREFFGLLAYDQAALPVRSAGNVYLNGATPAGTEIDPTELPGDLGLRLTEQSGEWFLTLSIPPRVARQKNELVTTSMLGKATVPDQAYSNPDGSPLAVDTDYLGNPRSPTNPVAGPFEITTEGLITVSVWK